MEPSTSDGNQSMRQGGGSWSTSIIAIGATHIRQVQVLKANSMHLDIARYDPLNDNSKRSRIWMR